VNLKSEFKNRIETLLPYSLVKRAAGENRWFLPHGKVNGYIKK